MRPHKIGILIYQDFELLDMSGPQTAFYEANGFIENHVKYEQITIALHDGPVITEAGTKLLPDKHAQDITAIDTLIVPGGKGSRFDFDDATLKQIQRLVNVSKRVVSICTGVFIVARAGLPQNAVVTTHWNFAQRLKHDFPNLKVADESIYANYQKFWSSAGVTAGIDLALRLIEDDHNSQVASQVAKNLVVFLKRAGNQTQYSQLLDAQYSDSRLDKISEWLLTQLNKKVSVIDIAHACHTSERQIYRLFNRALGMSPAKFVERHKLQWASEQLTASDRPIKQIASDVGYGHYDSFRRAFDKVYGMSPILYRAHFRSSE